MLRPRRLGFLHGGPSLKDFKQSLQCDGLGDKVVHARFEALLATARHGVGRHGNDGHVPAWPFPAPDLSGGLVPVHFGHLAVHENQIVRQQFEYSDRLAAVCRYVRAQPESFQHPYGNLLVHHIVLGHQHSNRPAR